MTKTVKINTNDGTRRVELDAPPTVKRAYIMNKAPTPLKMDTKTVNWVNKVIKSTTTIDKPELLNIETAFELFGKISHYWGEIDEDPELSDTDKVAEEGEFSDVPIDEYGMVDVENMR